MGKIFSVGQDKLNILIFTIFYKICINFSEAGVAA